eukprot:4164983-Prymnesium_polylepis.1
MRISPRLPIDNQFDLCPRIGHRHRGKSGGSKSRRRAVHPAPAKALHDGMPMQQVCARQQAHRARRRRAGDWRRPRPLHEAGKHAGRH